MRSPLRSMALAGLLVPALLAAGTTPAKAQGFGGYYGGNGQGYGGGGYYGGGATGGLGGNGGSYGRSYGGYGNQYGVAPSYNPNLPWSPARQQGWREGRTYYETGIAPNRPLSPAEARGFIAGERRQAQSPWQLDPARQQGWREGQLFWGRRSSPDVASSAWAR